MLLYNSATKVQSIAGGATGSFKFYNDGPLEVGIAGAGVTAGVSLGIGYALSSWSPNIWTFALAQGLFVGLLGSSALFAPLIADTSLWFDKRRGIAVGVCAIGGHNAPAR